jgi:integrase/recombinase XerD
MQDLRRFDEMINKNFVDVDEQDVRKAVSELNQTELKESTKRDFKLGLRKFYCFIRGVKKKGVYPPEVEWISLAISNNHKKLPEELLTEEEIESMVRCCDNPRDKALVASLAETGARVSEIGNMKIKHVSFEEHGARLNLHGKTGTRKVLVIGCSPYLQEWINHHPNNSNPDAYLWYNPHGELLCYGGLTVILKKSARRARIKKRIYPHLLRHSRATRMASIMSEAAMKQYFGWTQSSKMAGIYVHMSGKDTDEAILRANGIQSIKIENKQRLTPVGCVRCKTKNSATNKFCFVCGFILDRQVQEEIIRKESENTQLNEVMDYLVKDSDVMELIAKKLAEKKRGQKTAENLKYACNMK